MLRHSINVKKSIFIFKHLDIIMLDILYVYIFTVDNRLRNCKIQSITLYLSWLNRTNISSSNFIAEEPSSDNCKGPFLRPDISTPSQNISFFSEL